MRRIPVIRLLAPAFGAVLFAAATSAQPPAGDRPGWTGLTDPDGVIAARQALMFELEQLMRPIDTRIAGDEVDPDTLRAAAQTIAAMLLSVPHLFPPTTDRYDPDAAIPATLALPAVWQDFATFVSLSSATAAAAGRLAEAERPADMPAAAESLRGACDACHTLYLEQYTPPEVTSEDLEIDFDSLLNP